jgi:hypothetical protein
MAAACTPASRAASKSLTAKNPQDDPINARTPTPAFTSSTTRSIRPLAAPIRWCRDTTVRASA